MSDMTCGVCAEPLFYRERNKGRTWDFETLYVKGLPKSMMFCDECMADVRIHLHRSNSCEEDEKRHNLFNLRNFPGIKERYLINRLKGHRGVEI